MEIDYDPAKNARNIKELQLPFEQAAEYDFDTALTVVDNRRDYGETRFRSIGRLKGRVHVLVFVELPDGIRVISFRKGNKREVRDYEKASKP